MQQQVGMTSWANRHGEGTLWNIKDLHWFETARRTPVAQPPATAGPPAPGGAVVLQRATCIIACGDLGHILYIQHRPRDVLICRVIAELARAIAAPARGTAERTYSMDGTGMPRLERERHDQTEEWYLDGHQLWRPIVRTIAHFTAPIFAPAPDRAVCFQGTTVMGPRHHLPDVREPDNARGPRALERCAVPEAPGTIGSPTPGDAVVIYGTGMPRADGELGYKGQPGGLRHLHRQALRARAAITQLAILPSSPAPGRTIVLPGTAKLLIRGNLRDIGQPGDLDGGRAIKGSAVPQLVVGAFAPAPGGAVMLHGTSLVDSCVHLRHLRERDLNGGELRLGNGAIAQPAMRGLAPAPQRRIGFDDTAMLEMGRDPGHWHGWQRRNKKPLARDGEHMRLQAGIITTTDIVVNRHNVMTSG